MIEFHVSLGIKISLLGKLKFFSLFLLIGLDLFSSGTRNSGDILIYDVRQKDCLVKLQTHRQEVCGLKWCPNGRYLASGSNDNTVCVWDFHQWYSNTGVFASNSLLPPAEGRRNQSNVPTKPLWHFKDHKAAVKVGDKESFVKRLSLFLSF